ncbi:MULTISPECIES: TolC family outer membrane protein [unclassified Serratia (in: enterobacteria)]|uniref:TolC family outer membrane protein n=1 Tax=unclassified Serratia (in: enterobacteria) TaxID=2647522 RepID=UPI002ED0DA2C|nr:TolC family outer membrane protein [Serratia sp. C2(2)]MEE4449339.1 TolC family outer membrane protein [Serratia sp. C2(1)]
MKYYYSRVLPVVFFWGGLFFSHVIYATTLQESVLAASVHDTEISAARNAQEADSQRRIQGIAGLLPNISLDSSYMKQEQPHASYATGVKRHNYTVNLTQPLFDMSKYAAWERGVAIANSADITLLIAQQKLISSVADSFFMVLYQREVLHTNQSAKSTYSRQLAKAKMALKLGEGTLLDVDEAQANYDKSVAKEISATNELADANTAYFRITGLNPDTISPINMQCMPSYSEVDLASLQQRAEKNNLSIQSAIFQLDQNKADLTAANGAHLPVVTLQASYGGNWSKAEDENGLDRVFGTTSKTRSSTIGVNVSIPIFSGGAQISQSIEALRRRDQGKDMLEDARRKARQETQSAYLGVKNGVALFSAEQKSLISAKNKVKSTKYGREIGLRTAIDELNAEQDYYKTLQDLAEVQYNFLTSKIKLSAAIGQLDYSTLSEYNCAKENSKSIDYYKDDI